MRKRSGDSRGFFTLAAIVLVVLACVFCYSEYSAKKRQADNKTEVIMLKPESSGFKEFHIDSEDFNVFKDFVNKLKDTVSEE